MCDRYINVIYHSVIIALHTINRSNLLLSFLEFEWDTNNTNLLHFITVSYNYRSFYSHTEILKYISTLYIILTVSFLVENFAFVCDEFNIKYVAGVENKKKVWINLKVEIDYYNPESDPTCFISATHLTHHQCQPSQKWNSGH